MVKIDVRYYQMLQVVLRFYKCNFFVILLQQKHGNCSATRFWKSENVESEQKSQYLFGKIEMNFTIRIFREVPTVGVILNVI